MNNIMVQVYLLVLSLEIKISSVSVQVHWLSYLLIVAQAENSVQKIAFLNLADVGMQEMQTLIVPWSVCLACYVVTHYLVTLNTV